MQVSRQEFSAAVQAARKLARVGGETVVDVLLRSARWKGDELAELLRSVAGVTWLPDRQDVSIELSRLSVEQARELDVVPFRRSDAPDVLMLAMADPWNEVSFRRASKSLGTALMPAAVSRAWLNTWLGLDGGNEAALFVTSPKPVATELNDLEAKGPVVAFVDSAIRGAYAMGASDIHFECSRQGVLVRLRCDGVLSTFSKMEDLRRTEEVISRIKVLAQLDITERRLPQDGRFRWTLPDGDIDLRVSIIPSVFGEDAVLRLLDKAQLRDPKDLVTLDLLGFDEDSASQIRELVELPHGMLLVTGPTGSGKTTTVYAALSEVNNGFEKIITIEDPVEYELAGVLQVPVNERKGLTFAKGLRSVLRHDPDRILVGEIRDAETAEIAVQSALTGHQVLTTVHANSVFDVTGRFKHFGLDMFGFMAALNGVIVQRLIRCLCQNCVSVRATTSRERIWLESQGPSAVAQVPLAVGCESCGGTGYKGRRVIAEVHSIDDQFRDLVTTSSPVSALRAHVYREGGRSLGQLGAALVLKHVTSTEEIKRVVGWK